MRLYLQCRKIQQQDFSFYVRISEGCIITSFLYNIMNHPQTNLTHQNLDSPAIFNFPEFDSIDVNSDQQVEKLINFINKLEPNPEGIKAVKKLLLSYGVPIMIYLKPLYERITQPVPQSLKQALKKLASIALQMSDNIKIPQLQFIFAYGTMQKFKKVQKQSQYKQFINFVKQMGDLSISIKNGNIIPLEKYRFCIQQNINTHNYTALMLKSLQLYTMTQEELNKLQQGHEKDQATVRSQQSWSEVEDQDKYQSNFYAHQQSKLSSPNEPKNCISISLSLDSSSNQFDQSSFEKSSQYIINKKLETLCCKKYFIEGQQIKLCEDVRNSFMNAKYPFKRSQQTQIKKNMCSFLNCQGGILYIGISKNKKTKNQVSPDFYTESDKQNLLKNFRKIAQSIEPNILIQKMYGVQFVPVRQKQTKEYIPGAYVVKVTVNYGIRDQFYSYEQSGYDHFPFRNGIEIIQRQGRQLLKAYRYTIKNPMPIPQPLHDYPCQKPQIGEQLFSEQQKKTYKLMYEKSKEIGYQTKRDAIQKRQTKKQVSSISHASTRPSTIRQQAQPISLKKEQHASSAELHEFSSHSVQMTRRQGQQQQQTLFLIVGLDEKMLVPVLVAKKLQEKVELETFKPQKIIAKVKDPIAVQPTRKLFNSIGVKYKDKGILTYELTLYLEIQRLQQAKQCLTKIKAKYKTFQHNVLKFQLLRDSLQAFLLLQTQKISVKFVQNKKQ